MGKDVGIWVKIEDGSPNPQGTFTIRIGPKNRFESFEQRGGIQLTDGLFWNKDRTVKLAKELSELLKMSYWENPSFAQTRKGTEDLPTEGDD